MKTTTPTQRPTRYSTRPQRPPPLWLRLLRRPIHALLIALLLWPPQAWAAIAPAGDRAAGSSAPADLVTPQTPGAASDRAGATTAAGSRAGQGPTGELSAARSAARAASGLSPELEALIAAEEQRERREAQSRASINDAGSGLGAGSPSASKASAALPPRVDPSTGSARFEIPILVPPGRRDARPTLKLVYSSDAGDSPYGYGWQLPIGHIARSTKWGVPSCPLNETDAKADFVLSLNGRSLELKRVVARLNGTMTHIYRPRLSESSLEAFALADQRNSWEVLDRAGNKYVFGEVPSARLHSGVDTFYDTRYNAATGAHCNFTTMWRLTRFVSPNGNEVVYRYFKDPHNSTIYLQSLDYGGNSTSPALREAPFRIELTRSVHPLNWDRGAPAGRVVPAPRSISYARGVLERRYFVIDRIRVLYRPGPGKKFQLIRQYKLDHQSDPYTGRNLLQRVRTLDPAGRELAPPQTFEYASSRLDFAPEVTVRGPLPSTDTYRLGYETPGGAWRIIIDANGDGYKDIFNAKNNTVYLGSQDGFTGATFRWRGGFNNEIGFRLTDSFNHSTRDRRGRPCHQGPTEFMDGAAFIDITGDALPDRLDMKLSFAVHREIGKEVPTSASLQVWPSVCRSPAQCAEGALVAPPPLRESTVEFYRDICGKKQYGFLHRFRIGHRQYDPGTKMMKTDKAMADFNADGFVDFVSSIPQDGVLRNVGSTTRPGFRKVPFRNSSVFHDIEVTQRHGGQDITRHMMLDVNGDSLPDRILYNWNHCVTFDFRGNVVGRYPTHSCANAIAEFSIDGSKVVFTNPVYVYLNSGRGFDHLIAWYLPSWGGGAASNQGLRRSLVDKGVIQDLRDLNGDGLPDFIEIRNGNWRVTYNQGGVIDYIQSPTAHFIAGNGIRQVQRSGEGTVTGVDLFDMDGDGLPELVNAWNMASWKVRKLRAPGGAPLVRPGLLVKVRNGLGATTELQYRPSTRYDNRDTAGAPRLPYVRWVVSALRQSDGLCDPGKVDVFSPARNPCSATGHDLITRYAYQGGLFDAASREFRGFRQVTMTDAVGNRRELTFSQADTTRGKLLRQEQWVGKQLLSKTNAVWRTRASLGRTQIYLAERKQEEFDLVTKGTHNRCLLTRNHPPDDFGRVGTTCSLSCKGAPATPSSCANPIGGQVDTVTTWANPLKNLWVRERPSHVLTRYKNAAGALETLVEKWFYYDGSGKDGLPAGQVKQGNVKRVVTKLDRSFAGPVVNPTVRNEYGAYGNLTATIDPNGRRSVSDYRGAPFQLYPRVVRNALGHTTTTVTDLRYGQPTSVTGPNGQVTAYRYDALGRTTCVAGPLDSIAGCGGTGPFTRSHEYRYVYGNPKAAGFQAKLSYVEERRREPWADGNAATHSAADYVATRSYSDALGRARFQMQQRVIGASGGALQWVVQDHVNYSAMGFVSATYVPYALRAGGSVTEFPNLGVHPHTLFDYRFNGGPGWDPLGRPHRVMPPDGHPITRYYGARVTFTYHPAPGASNAPVGVSGASRNGVLTVEDHFGRVTYKGYFEPVGTDKLGYYYKYDGLGRRLKTEIAGNVKTTVTTRYDLLGRTIQVTDPDLGNGARPGTVKLGYDLAGNLIYRDTPVARERVQWCFDALNRPTARFLRTDGDAYVASLCSNTATAETRYTYDSTTAGPYAKGRLARVDDAAGYATFVYDARGRVTRRTRSSPGPGGPRGGSLSLTTAYDLADHVTALTYPDGEVVRSRYNRAGQVVSVAGTSTYLKDLQYDFQGRSDLITHGNGSTAQPVVDDLAYHGAGESFRLRELHTVKGTKSYYRTSYAYEERGRISKITDHLRSSGPLSSTNAYIYDGLSRLVKTDWLANGRTTDAYDAAYAFDRWGNLTQKGSLRGAVKIRFHATRYHQITSYGSQGTEHAVAYDTAGRMASRVVKTGATAAAAKSESYFFDAVDRLTRVVVHAGTGRYVTGAAQESTTRHWYDSEGQRVRTQVTAGTTTSNTHHLFAEVEVRDGEMTKYYFAGGLRIAGRVVTPSTTSSAADLLAGAPFRGVALPPGVAVGLALVLLLLLLSPGLRGASRWRALLVPTRVVATAAFFWLALLPPGLAKAALPGDVTLWHYHLDHLGSTHSITDASGNLYRQTRTTAYGEVRGRYDGSGNIVAAEVALRHEFTGYQSEEKSGLQYAGARYYLPELGIFTSHDPEDQFPSPYAYGNGDPVNGTDPDGAYFGGIANSFFSGLNDFARDAVGRTLTGLAFGGNFFLGHSVYDRYIRGSGFDDVLYGVGIAGAGFIPGVGEAFDAYDLFRPSSARWERGLAAASLGLSAYTLGGSPNYGSTIRGARHVARGADKLWATGSRLYNSARSTWRSWRGGGAPAGGGALTRVPDFADTPAAFRHYAKHARGVELGPGGSAILKHGGADLPEFSSFREYRSAARSFFSGGPGKGVEQGARANGDMIRFHPSTGHFGVMSPDGIIRTFFRPDNPQQYFLNQF